MLKLKIHPDVTSSDLPHMESLVSEEEFAELMNIVDDMIKETRTTGKLRDSQDCEYPPLMGWKKKRFHSMRKPPQGRRADTRIIFRVDTRTNTLLILAIGFRIKSPKRHPNDPYQRVKIRDLSRF